FLLVGTSSYLGRNLISLFPSQEIIFFHKELIAGLFISSYLWCTISWNVELKEGIYARRVLYMDIRGQGATPLTCADGYFTRLAVI
ncbi:hypothetical protein M8C21_000464, partial [Ambrosia artemisiifolia]